MRHRSPRAETMQVTGVGAPEKRTAKEPQSSIGLVQVRDLGRTGLKEVLGDIARGFEDVIQAGLARHAGFTGLGETPAIVEVVRAEPYETVQTYFNMLNPSAGYAGKSGGQQDFGGLIDTAASAGVGVIVIRVLAAGAAAAQPDRAENAGDPGRGLVSGAAYESDVQRAKRMASLAK